MIKDEQLNGTITHQFEINVESEFITAKELIEKRVTFEVEQYNTKFPEYYQGLIEPTESEKTLNGYKLKKRQFIDPEKQVYIALDAFQKNGYFILVDDKQVDELSETISLKQDSIISFVKLTPLIGG
ncbi:MAG: hypothetical protein R2774_09855 [Saprospiraceae bacterium]